MELVHIQVHAIIKYTLQQINTTLKQMKSLYTLLLYALHTKIAGRTVDSFKNLPPE